MCVLTAHERGLKIYWLLWRRENKMFTYLKISTMVVLITAVATAAPMCTTDTYANYEALGAGGCTVGDETFSNFSDLSFSNSLGVLPLGTGQILITPTPGTNEASLSFSYQTAAGGTPITIMFIDNSQVFAFDFTYAVSGKNLGGIQQTAAFSNTSPGAASFTKNAMPTGGPIFTSAVTDEGSSHVSATYDGPVTDVSGAKSGDFLVKDAIALQAQSGTVSNSGFTNNFFLVAPGQTGTVPEPPVSVLIGGGLVLIGSLTRKVAERRRRLNA
jgi:hypothetical protein